MVAYGVSRRRQEFGIRLALGASPGDVQRRVLSDTLRLAVAGLAFGLPAAWLVSRLMQDLLFGVTPADPTTFAGMVAVLGAMAMVAAYVPARRASRLDPDADAAGSGVEGRWADPPDHREARSRRESSPAGSRPRPALFAITVVW